MKIKTSSLLFLMLAISIIACKSENKKKGQDWNKIEKSVSNWEYYKLNGGLEALFPQRPTSKSKGFSAEITFYENYTEKDSVTYSVNIIENKALKDDKAWQKFLNEEVLLHKNALNAAIFFLVEFFLKILKVLILIIPVAEYENLRLIKYLKLFVYKSVFLIVCIL